ncbi:MAG: hypothetical protein H8K03_13720 [Nitrospira sp.]|jgi:hypothetical protein|nr:hypothetical protein [Nitrospira sp. BO4]
MKPLYSDILNASKYRHKFPPHALVDQIKSDLASTGMVGSGAAIKLISLTYCLSAETVLYEFAAHILRNLPDLGLTSQESLLEVIGEAFTTIMAEARGCALRELPIEESRELASSYFNERSGRFLEQLQRKVHQTLSDQLEQS